MDLNNIKKSVANLSLYDIKAGVRQLQNAVMNYTEMEAKVREATNNEPWGASSTIMQDIANGTFNYQLLNEIMPMIYHRFTEKSAEQWRQIYKALQLLEFLIKNGSERVIDDARAHLSLLKMLKQFHFIDQNGKDQGINVRNRSKELVELLSDVEKIRSERKKAKQNRAKYGGYEGGGGGGINSDSGSSAGRYGGFGSESGGSTAYGGYDGRVYGDGGGFGGESSGTYSGETQSRRDNFKEYDEFEEGARPSSARRKVDSPSSPTSKRESKKPAAAAKPKEPEVDLFDFGDEPIMSSSTAKAPVSLGLGALQAPAAAADDDDFDDFQSAPVHPAPASSNAFSIPAPISSSIVSNTQFAAPKPQSGTQSQSINDLFSSVSPPPPSAGNASASSSTILSPAATIPQSKPAQPTSYQRSQPNYFTSVSISGAAASTPSSTLATVSTTPGGLGKPIAPIGSAAPKKPAGDAFAGLLGGISAKKDSTAAGKGQTMADLARQKTSAGIWGAGSPGIGGGTSAPAGSASKPPQGQPKLGNGLDDLLG